MSRTWLRLLVSVGVLAVLFYRVGVVDVLEIFLRARPGLLALAFVLYTLGQVMSALRWCVLAHGVGFETSAVECVRIYFIGMFFGLAIPSTLGADGARTLYLGREAPGQTRALSSVVFDRWVGLVTLVGVAVAALLLGPSGDLPSGLVTAIVTMGGLLVGGWLLAPPVARLLPEGGRLRRLIEEDLVPYFRDRRLLAFALSFSLFVHAVQIVTQKVLTDALGLDVPLDFVAIYHPLVVLATAIPITIGGFGLREAAYAYLLPHAGIATGDAVALALLWWAIGALGGLLGGLLYAGKPAPIARI